MWSDRVPVAGARVATRIASGWRSTTTDLQGRFTLQVDGLPYDLAVVVPAASWTCGKA